MKKMKRVRFFVTLLVATAVCAISACGADDGAEPPDQIGDSQIGDPQADWITLDLKYATYLPETNIVVANTIDKLQGSGQKAHSMI